MLASIQGAEGLPLLPTTAKSFATGEELFLYLAVSLAAISIALIRKKDKVQKPVYYASRVFRGA